MLFSLKEKECAQICWHAFHMLRISYNATCTVFIVFTMSTLDSGFVWCTLNAHYVYIWDRVDREQCKQLLAVFRRLRCPSYYSTKAASPTIKQPQQEVQTRSSVQLFVKGKASSCTQRGTYWPEVKNIKATIEHSRSLTSILEHFHSNLFALYSI